MQQLIVIAKGFKQCRKSDPEFDECVRSGIQSAIPHLVNGKNVQTNINYRTFTFWVIVKYIILYCTVI